MSRPIRWFQSGVYFYEIVIKCSGDEMLMRPDPLAVLLIAQAIAGACKKYPRVRILALGFVSNHAHILIWIDDDAPVSWFMKAMNQKIAQDLNAHRDRGGHFFKDRFRPTPILTTESLLERLTYVHAQPVHHDLVDCVEDWPGLSSFRAVCDAKTSVDVSVLDEAAWRDAGAKPTERAKFTQSASIPIAPFPLWEGLSEIEHNRARQAHEGSVRAREREKAAERRAKGQHRRLEPSRLTQIDPFSRPVGKTERRPRPWAHGDEKAVKEYRAAYSKMLEVYQLASARFRATGVMCPFPAGTFPPRIEAPFEVM